MRAERSRPDVTVVIPTRNRWDLLSRHGLRSALGQEDVEVEVIVVDDGSTDGTATRLAEADDPRLRVIRHEHSRGMAGARNAGIAAARSEWLAFLDDDDLWAPRKLRAQLDAARTNGAEFVYAAAVLVYDERVASFDVLPNESELLPALLESDVIPAGASNVLARTELVRRLGGFDERLLYSADWDLWIKLALAGRAAVCDEILVAHIQHGGNALLRDRPDVIGEFEYIVEKHAARMGPAGRSRARRGLHEWLVHEYRQAGYSRTRAYLEVVRGQPSLRHAARAVGELSRERGRRVARSVVRRLTPDPPSRREERAVAATEPTWLRMYRSDRES